MSGMKGINKILLKPTEKLVIRLSVTLADNLGKINYYSVFETPTGSYGILDIAANLKFEYKENRTKWSRQDTIYVNAKNIYQLKIGLLDFKKILYDDSSFSYEDNGGISVETNRMTTISLGYQQFMRLRPAVIYSNNEAIPGVLLTINIESNTVDLSIDEFESILYLIDTFNFSLETSLLLNSYLLLSKEQYDSHDESKQEEMKPKLNVFQRKEINDSQKEMVSGNIIKTPTTLDDI